jgi:hypothetical protein
MTLGNMRANGVRMERRRDLIRDKLLARPKSGVGGAPMFRPIIKSLIVIAGVIACASILSACEHSEPPLAIAAPIIASPPPPPKKWYKDGAGTEEFQRTRARCVMNAYTAARPDDIRWSIILATCMRSEGWVLR